MDLIVGKYNQFIKSMAHDLKVILSLDNGILKMTRERDATEQSGGKWEGPDVRASNTQNNQNQFSKTNKPKKSPHKW